MSQENLIEKYGKDEETKNVVRKYLLSEYENSDDESIQEALSNGKHPIATKCFLKDSSLAAPTLASILGELTICLAPFVDDNVKENMQYSDFRMMELMNSDRPV